MHTNQAGVPNNGPCVPLTVVGGAEVTIRPPLINMGNIFQKDSKSSEKRLRQTDRRTGKGPLKLQIGMSSNLYLTRRFKRIKADTVTLRTSIEQMLSHTRTKRI